MDLTDLVPSLKRAVAAPGEFDTYFGEATENDLAGLLADAIAEAMLDGFLAGVALDLDQLTALPDLTQPQQALVVLYGSTRVLTARIANLKNHTRYKAGAAEAESEQSASVLVELLKQAKERKKQLLDDARYGGGASFAMVDLYVSKSIDVSDAAVGYIYPGRM